jgi:hypothetical protein
VYSIYKRNTDSSSQRCECTVERDVRGQGEVGGRVLGLLWLRRNDRTAPRQCESRSCVANRVGNQDIYRWEKRDKDPPGTGKDSAEGGEPRTGE